MESAEGFRGRTPGKPIMSGDRKRLQIAAAALDRDWGPMRGGVDSTGALAGEGISQAVF